ncbi:MAG: hypothetical protein IJW63_09255 [Lachnospiraceae bacterium]|nr:hypothetical protein [Lachnospiraceae bacterium]
MKKKQTVWFIIMLCWWGFLFPELTFTEDSLRVVYAKEEVELNQDQWEKYVEFLGAEPEQVKIKSRLLEWLGDLW